RAAIGDALDAASRRLQAVHRFIADAAAFLPAYELRRAQQRANELQEHVRQRQDELVPRQRFGFRGKRAARAQPAEVTTQPKATPAPAAPPPPPADECGFRDRSDAPLQLRGAAVTGRDVTLTCLTRCRVRVTGAPATVHLSHLRDCRLLLGPVATSVFLEDCRGCTLAVACQQLRAHTSADCDIYLHVTSRAVVEHCERLRFAPYSLGGEDVRADWATTGLSADRNSWNDVDDFNWLSKAQRSPNWSILPEEERLTSWEDGEEDLSKA
ncbi:tubulin-specific chaperone C-like, partial [Pollicipes pollicipes]|uniref:tubulin-specific chaperone C-like n=1 Tax=Pollicipes pollicipes TaxID=41117 RepID=UPI00188507F9